MEDHEIRRKIIREWMALPKDKRQTEEQVAAFAKKAVKHQQTWQSFLRCLWNSLGSRRVRETITASCEPAV